MSSSTDNRFRRRQHPCGCSPRPQGSRALPICFLHPIRRGPSLLSQISAPRNHSVLDSPRTSGAGSGGPPRSVINDHAGIGTCRQCALQWSPRKRNDWDGEHCKERALSIFSPVPPQMTARNTHRGWHAFSADNSYKSFQGGSQFFRFTLTDLSLETLVHLLLQRQSTSQNFRASGRYCNQPFAPIFPNDICTSPSRSSGRRFLPSVVRSIAIRSASSLNEILPTADALASMENCVIRKPLGLSTSSYACVSARVALRRDEQLH